MPTVTSKNYSKTDLQELADRIRRHAFDVERIVKFLEERDIESVSINYGAGLTQALHKVALFTSDADRATLKEIME